MKSIYSGVVIVFLFVLVFTSLSLIGSEQTFSDLDSKSQNVLLSIDSTLNEDINISKLEEESGFNNTNTEDKSSFGFEFLSAKSDAEKKVSVLNTIKNSPEMIVASTGLETEPFSPYISAAKWFIGFLLALIAFDAVFTRRVFNK
jgi:hypothetical protein